MKRPTRDELKYLITTKTWEALRANWGHHLIRDPYTDSEGCTPILSQYYDSPSLDFYEEKMDGIGHRNKLRIRTYGTSFRIGEPIFFEIKQRVYHRIRKIRSKPQPFEPKLLNPANWSFDDPTDASAFLGLRDRYQLKPTAQVWYIRQAFQGLVHADLRITLDSQLAGIFPKEKLNREFLTMRNRNLLSDGLAILEIKATGSIPNWVKREVIRFGLQAQPIPKYVMAMDRLGIKELYPTIGGYL
jgi:hypothetical protein